MIIDDNPSEQKDFNEDNEEIKEDVFDDDRDFPMDECMKDNNKKYTPEDFKRLYVIGKGSYGKVYQVRKILQPATETQPEVLGDLYAMKVLKKAELRQRKQVEHTKSERRILEKIHHPFVVGLN
mmetsp:Transcript_41804/g.48290  ORF Transcript_41804/g.48290 Transcript_41804/m.48290 type:complete len:124 (+) Transcript_41804:191-562(+)